MTLSLVVLWGSAQAATTIAVRSAADAVAANPAAGCATAAAGPCTLRSAIQAANAVGGDVTINVPAGT